MAYLFHINIPTLYLPDKKTRTAALKRLQFYE
nr:MAG TPA: hypothetical protein [Caudoviricetes sp.]